MKRKKRGKEGKRRKEERKRGKEGKEEKKKGKEETFEGRKKGKVLQLSLFLSLEWWQKTEGKLRKTGRKKKK